jgi:glycine C-acetyltransferase
MTDKFAWIAEELASLEDQGLRSTIRTIGSPCGPWMVVDGKRVLNFCTNNYLGLANHPKLKAAARQAVEDWGVGPAAVRSIAGTLELHRQLEERLARFKGVEDTLYVQSGFCANQAAIPPMVGKGDVIFTDRLNHASIIDGCRLSSATVVVYEHCDVADAERVIEENAGRFRRSLLITDGVFSMDGDVAPLDRLFELCERHGIMTMVDDAHGEGVLGRGGRGIVDHFGLNGRLTWKSAPSPRHSESWAASSPGAASSSTGFARRRAPFSSPAPSPRPIPQPASPRWIFWSKAPSWWKGSGRTPVTSRKRCAGRVSTPAPA